MLPEEHLDNIENGNEGDGDVYESSLRRDEKMKPLPLKDAIFWFLFKSIHGNYKNWNLMR